MQHAKGRHEEGSPNLAVTPYTVRSGAPTAGRSRCRRTCGCRRSFRRGKGSKNRVSTRYWTTAGRGQHVGVGKGVRMQPRYHRQPRRWLGQSLVCGHFVCTSIACARYLIGSRSLPSTEPTVDHVPEALGDSVQTANAGTCHSLTQPP